MTTIALTASTGMLGQMAYRVLRERFDLVLLYRDEAKLRLLDGAADHRLIRVDYADLFREFVADGTAAAARLVERIGPVDAVLNTAGVIIPRMRDRPELTFFVNGALPHLLAAHYGPRLIHITTDCVYSGRAGAPYDESAPSDPKDLYGMSKAMGEPTARSLVLRTSIIGPELDGHASLLEWLRSRRGEIVDGYTNHFWNGLTTKALAECVATIVADRAAHPATGCYHLSSTAVSKEELLRMLDTRYGLGVTVRPREVEPVDRRLATVHGLNAALAIPPLDAMLDALP
jgi:dTDP-4-dehydrorhamnose reductase